MLEQAVGDWIAPGGLAGVVLAGLYAILKGHLVPGATVDRLTDQWEARLTESHQREQDWQAAATAEHDARTTTTHQLGELMTLARTTEALLKALPAPRDRGSSGRGN